MMLVWVLVLTALLASDVAGTTDSFGLEETQQDLEERGIVKGRCNENWFYFRSLNSCYRFFCDERTWSDAEAFCNHQPHYGHLATVTSSRHNKFITKVIGAVSKENPETWIGLDDRCQEGTYTWIDGSSLGYQCWDGNQPDNYKDNEDCVHINYNREGVWNDRPCDEKHGFVCSYRLHCD